MSEKEQNLLNDEQDILYEDDLPDKDDITNVEYTSAEQYIPYENTSVDNDIVDTTAEQNFYEDEYSTEGGPAEEYPTEEYPTEEYSTEEYFEEDEPTEEDLAREEHRKQKKAQRKKTVFFKSLILAGVLLIMALMAGRYIHMRKSGPINVAVKNVSMLQGDAVPKFKVTVSSKRNPKNILDEKSGYKVKDLLKDLSEGDGIETTCKADGSKEGNFKIKVKVTDEMKQKISKEWKTKIKFILEDGTLEVKNQYGEMEEDKFKLWDGKYASDRFIPYHGKTYYFDKNGIKATGWKTVEDSKYFFDKEGVMQTGWKKGEKATYFFEDDGKMKTGWHEENDKKYYFDDDGKMQVGDFMIGTKKYTFDKTGVLSSEKIEIDPSKPMIALTFDDGPGERTNELLDVLDSYGSRATFFMLGRKVGKNEEVVRKMYTLGNELGNHSWDHEDLTDLDEAGIQQEIDSTIDAVEKATGQKPTVMRPPYGSINAEVRENARAPLVMWSIDTLDWKTRDTQQTIDTVMENAKDGDVILIHDIHSPSVDAAIRLIPALIDKGFQIVTVSEMAEAKGIDMNNGEKYFKFN